MKSLIILFLGCLLIPQWTLAQGITRSGETPVSSSVFVDKYGQTGNAMKLGKNGQIIGPPAITTSGVNSSSITSITTGGNISYQGGNPVTARGICWGLSPNPTVADGYTTDGTGGGSFTSTVTGLSYGTVYYFRAYATNASGTSYGNEISLQAGVGLTFQGGKIAYIYQPGDPGYIVGEQHGIIAAPYDQGGDAQWGCYGTIINGADGIVLGTGKQNTIDIVNGCTMAGIAARLCNDLVIGEYSDWYLPSFDELYKLYLNRAAIGGFVENFYWSSTETSNIRALGHFFWDNGYALNHWKDGHPVWVRAIRYF